MKIFTVLSMILMFFTPEIFANIKEAIEQFNKKNYRQSYKLFINEMLNENPQSFYYLGIMNEKGLGMEINERKAADLYEKGAKLNEEKCLYMMGLIYLNGLFNKVQNTEKALLFLKKAEEKGNIDAGIKLGEIYYYGFSNIMPDFDKAFKYFNKNSKNNMKAKYYVGLMMINGQGTEKDVKKGFNILYQSAISGDVMAQMEVGKIYMDGKIVEKNYDAAIKWFKRAAKEKIEEAAFYIGVIYSDNEYIKCDKLISYGWHIIAARYGNSNSAAIIDIERKKFTEKEINQAHKIAEENIREIFRNP